MELPGAISHYIDQKLAENVEEFAVTMDNTEYIVKLPDRQIINSTTGEAHAIKKNS